MQIEILGDNSDLRSSFERALADQCAALSIDLQLAGSAPDVSVVFPPTGSAWTLVDKMSASYQHLKSAEHGVLPVVNEALEASKLPADLSRFNAFQTGIWNTAWADGLVDEVLSLGWQHRRERRVFISYKRSDSGLVARQLHDALTDRGYITFLDDVSIGKGLDFQRELKWWLNDADAMIILATTNLPNSRWCMEEINTAKSAGVGLLAVAWPGLSSGPSILDAIDLDQRLHLVTADFDGAATVQLSELAAEGLTKVLAHTARQRAAAVRLRLENLIPLARQALKPKNGLVPAGEPGDFTFHDSAGSEHFVRLLPFRPDARALYEAFSSAASHQQAGCFYSECDEYDPRSQAIRWLADSRNDPTLPHRRTRIWAYVGDKELA